MTIVLEKMISDHLAQAHALSIAVRWPHRPEDWRLVLDLGAGVVAVDGNRVVGTAMWWRYDETIARIGMVIVDPSRQGAGIGHVLMADALRRCAGRCIVLNATADGLPLYKRLGFRPTGRIVQHQGVVRFGGQVAIPARRRLRDASASDLDALARLDAAAGGIERRRVIAALLVAGGALILEQDGAPIGFAVMRTFGRGALVGPVVAGSHADAVTMIGALLSRHAGGFVRIDIFDDDALSTALEKCGLVRVDEVQCMTLGTPPANWSDMRAFALVNQALG